MVLPKPFKDMKINIKLPSGLLTTLTIILVILKLVDLITISWFWVFSPILIPLALFATFGIFIVFPDRLG